MSEGRHRVVIVGGGYGGLAAAKALRRAPVEVTVIDVDASPSKRARRLLPPFAEGIAKA